MSGPTELKELPATDQKTKPRSESIIILIALALIWGSSFILMKKGLTALEPVEVGAVRIFSAFFVLLPFAISKMLTPTRREWRFLIVSGLLGNFLPAFLFATAGAHLSSAVSGSLNALSPLFTVLVGLAFFGISTSRRGLFGIAFGLVGAIALSFRSADVGALDINAMALLVVLATLCYAINLNLVKRHLKNVPPLSISALSLFFVGILAATFLVFDGRLIGHLRAGDTAYYQPVAYVVVLGVVGTALGLVLFNRLLKTADPVVASSVTYLMPAVAVGWGLLDGEQVFGIHYIGLALIFIGVVLVNRK